MTQEIKDFFAKFEKDSEKMKEQAGGMINGFGTLFGKVMGKGAPRSPSFPWVAFVFPL